MRTETACNQYDGLCSGHGRAFFEKVTPLPNGQTLVEYLCSFHADMASRGPGVVVRVIGSGSAR